MGRPTKEHEQGIADAENDIASILEILQAVRVLSARLRRVADLQELAVIITAAQRIKARAVGRRAQHSPTQE